MGFSLPKPPMFSSVVGLDGSPRKPSVKKQPIEIEPPDWVEQIDGHFVSSCKWHDSWRFGSCFVVKYLPHDRSASGDSGFVNYARP